MKTIDDWVAALRSGNYEQTNGTLRRPAGSGEWADDFHYEYCCMGVGCEITDTWPDVGSDEGFWYLNFDRALADAIKEEFPGRLEIKDMIFRGVYMDGSDRISFDITWEEGGSGELGFAGMNDDQEMTFPQIADVVEHFFDTSKPLTQESK